MNDTSLPPRPDPDPALQLQRDIHLVAVDTLRRRLPPPPGEDTPETRARRDRVAIATVASLVPANPAETFLAAQHVAAMAHADACLILAVQCGPDLKEAGRCRAQSASMGREARGYLGKLLQAQAERRRREATPAGCDSAAWTELRVNDQMNEALERLPPVPVMREAAGPEAAAPSAATATDPGAPPPGRVRPRDVDDWSEEEKEAERLRIRADHWVICNTRHARAIRQLGGLPENCDFKPPEPDVLDFILNGASANLRWADTYQTGGA